MHVEVVSGYICFFVAEINESTWFEDDVRYLSELKTLTWAKIRLQSNRQNGEQLQYLRNVNCVMTNHNKDQGMQASNKIKN